MSTKHKLAQSLQSEAPPSELSALAQRVNAEYDCAKALRECAESVLLREPERAYDRILTACDHLFDLGIIPKKPKLKAKPHARA